MSRRPTRIPTWATDANYPAGSNPWNATPIKVEPSSGIKAAGHTPDTRPPPQWMNDWQNLVGDGWIDYFDKRRILIADEFTGDQINRGIWQDASGHSGVAVGQDNTGFGVVFIEATAGDANPVVTSQGLFLDTRDFRFRVLQRYTTLNTSGIFQFGFFTGAAYYSFKSQNGVFSGRWNAHLNGVDHDTGVAPSGTWQLLEIIKRDGDLVFLIDGAVVYTAAAFATSLLVTVNLEASRTAADAKIRADRVELEVL